MTVTAGTGGAGTVDTTGGYIFNVTDGREAGATSVQVWNASDSSSNALVTCTGLHDAAAPMQIPIGGTSVIRFGEMGIRQVHVKSSTLTATITWGVAARTGASAM